MKRTRECPDTDSIDWQEKAPKIRRGAPKNSELQKCLFQFKMRPSTNTMEEVIVRGEEVKLPDSWLRCEDVVFPTTVDCEVSPSGSDESAPEASDDDDIEYNFSYRDYDGAEDYSDITTEGEQHREKAEEKIQKLDDEDMEYYMQLINKSYSQYTNSYCFSPLVISQIKMDILLSKRDRCNSILRRLADGGFNTRCAPKKMTFPMLTNGNHWVCFCVSTASHHVGVYNSFNDHSAKMDREALDDRWMMSLSVQQNFEALMYFLRYMGEQWDIKHMHEVPWTCVNCSFNRVQTDASSCGYYAIVAAETFSSLSPHLITQVSVNDMKYEVSCIVENMKQGRILNMFGESARLQWEPYVFKLQFKFDTIICMSRFNESVLIKGLTEHSMGIHHVNNRGEYITAYVHTENRRGMEIRGNLSLGLLPMDKMGLSTVRSLHPFVIVNPSASNYIRSMNYRDRLLVTFQQKIKSVESYCHRKLEGTGMTAADFDNCTKIVVPESFIVKGLKNQISQLLSYCLDDSTGKCADFTEGQSACGTANDRPFATDMGDIFDGISEIAQNYGKRVVACIKESAPRNALYWAVYDLLTEAMDRGAEHVELHIVSPIFNIISECPFQILTFSPYYTIRELMKKRIELPFPHIVTNDWLCTLYHLWGVDDGRSLRLIFYKDDSELEKVMSMRRDRHGFLTI